MNRSMTGLPVRHQLRSPPKPMPIESMMPCNHLTLCRPLLLLPSIFHSIRIFSNESAHHIRWPKYWSFSFNISPSKQHAGLISIRMDCLELCSPRDSQESSPTPQFKSINQALGFPDSSIGKESTCNAGDWFDSWVRKILCRRHRLTHYSILGLPLWLNW